MSGLPAAVAARISARLEEIGQEFRPGAKLTLLVRNDVGVGKDADFVMTNDELPDAVAALIRRHAVDVGVIETAVVGTSFPGTDGSGAAGLDEIAPPGPAAK